MLPRGVAFSHWQWRRHNSFDNFIYVRNFSRSRYTQNTSHTTFNLVFLVAIFSISSYFDFVFSQIFPLLNRLISDFLNKVFATSKVSGNAPKHITVKFYLKSYCSDFCNHHLNYLLRNESSTLILYKELSSTIRPQRSIETIASFDQWSETIKNHRKRW